LKIQERMAVFDRSLQKIYIAVPNHWGIGGVMSVPPYGIKQHESLTLVTGIGDKKTAIVSVEIARLRFLIAGS
jgi:hypothetical protein